MNSTSFEELQYIQNLVEIVYSPYIIDQIENNELMELARYFERRLEKLSEILFEYEYNSEYVYGSVGTKYYIERLICPFGEIYVKLRDDVNSSTKQYELFNIKCVKGLIR